MDNSLLDLHRKNTRMVLDSIQFGSNEEKVLLINIAKLMAINNNILVDLISTLNETQIDLKWALKSLDDSVVSNNVGNPMIDIGDKLNSIGETLMDLREQFVED